MLTQHTGLRANTAARLSAPQCEKQKRAKARGGLRATGRGKRNRGIGDGVWGEDVRHAASCEGSQAEQARPGRGLQAGTGEAGAEAEGEGGRAQGREARGESREARRGEPSGGQRAAGRGRKASGRRSEHRQPRSDALAGRRRKRQGRSGGGPATVIGCDGGPEAQAPGQSGGAGQQP